MFESVNGVGFDVKLYGDLFYVFSLKRKLKHFDRVSRKDHFRSFHGKLHDVSLPFSFDFGVNFGLIRKLRMVQ